VQEVKICGWGYVSVIINYHHLKTEYCRLFPYDQALLP